MGGGGAYDSGPDTLAHIRRVRERIDVFVAEMLARGRAHDASKLEEPEKGVLDRVLPLLDGVAYGSPEYEAVVERAHRRSSTTGGATPTTRSTTARPVWPGWTCSTWSRWSATGWRPPSAVRGTA